MDLIKVVTKANLLHKGDCTKNMVFHDMKSNHSSGSKFRLTNVTFEKCNAPIAEKRSPGE